MSEPFGKIFRETPLYERAMQIKLPEEEGGGGGEEEIKIEGVAEEVKELLKTYFGEGEDLMQDATSGESLLDMDMRGLSKRKLKKLDRKIKKISGLLLEDPSLSERIHKFKEHTTSYIEVKIRESKKAVNALKRKIFRRLQQVPNLTQEFSKQSETPVKISGELKTLKQLANEHFSDLIQEYDKHLADETIIPEPRYPDGEAFVIDIIRRRLW